MSRCFTWFPIGGYRRTQYIPEFGVIFKNMGIFLGGCLTCEELVGGYLQEKMGLFYVGNSIKSL